jgi:tetratricopeptide (TPR) repeat protein
MRTKRLFRVFGCLVFLAAAPASAQAPATDFERCLTGQDGSAEKLVICSRAIQAGNLAPDRLAAAYLTRGSAQGAQRNYPAAIQDFGEALKYRPEWNVAYASRCLALLLRDDRTRALADCNQATRLQPRDPFALSTRAFLHLKANDLVKADADFAAALAARPDYAQALWGRAYVAVKQGRDRDARRDVEAARRLDREVDADAGRLGFTMPRL